MRIAIAGAHATGKSTLAADLARTLPGHRLIDEPYYLLEAEGHVFAAAPTVEDFELQLDRSLHALAEERGPAIFDRSPADYVAYLLACRDGGRVAAARRFSEIGAAITSLDLLVFVPIERPDRIAGAEAGRLRRRVDAALEAGLVAGEWGLGVPVLAVSGPPRARAAQVLAHPAAVAAGSHRGDAP